MLASINRPSPFLPITSLQPQHYHAITHSFPQRHSAIPPIFNGFRTLSIATGVVPPSSFDLSLSGSKPPSSGLWPPFVFILLQIPFPASPFFSHPCKSPRGVPSVSSVYPEPRRVLRPQCPLCCAFSAFALQELVVAKRHADTLSSSRVRYSAPAFFVLPSFRKVPFSSSVKACRSCSCVFITMGPYQATGSSRGLPETSRKRMPSSPACTMTSSPRSNRTSERLSAVEGGAVSSQPTDSVGTERGSLALQNFPEPAKTYAKAWRVVSTGRAFLRPGATETSTYTGSVAMPSTGPRLPQKLPQTSRTCVPSSSVISGISGDFTSW